MEQKPLHYDGSFHFGQAEVAEGNEEFVMTDEMRLSIGRNPYSFETNE